MTRSSPSIVHVDLDAFYASVEQLDDPSLGGRPVIVGGLGPRGVVAAASYEARPFGIHSALPTARARRLAPPEAVFLAPRMDRYAALSDTVLGILGSFTPLVEPLALDEAFLDVSGARSEPHEIIATVRSLVREETGLTASIGAATTKLLAKLASELAKPDGMLVVEPGTELAVLHPLEVHRLWGVGPATHAKLERLGIRTVGDLASTDGAALAHALGTGRAEALRALASGRDDRRVVPDRQAKSVGTEQTFPTDITDRSVLESEVVRLADRVGSRLRRAHRACRTVHLKVRYGDFTTITRSRTRRDPTAGSRDIALEARALLEEVELGEGVRLLGVSVTLVDASSKTPSQPELPFDASSGPSEVRPDLEHAIDAVRERFGSDALRPGGIHPRGAP